MKELSSLVQRSFHVVPREEDFHTLALGASGRTIVRIRLGSRTCIGIRWGNDRADNDSFIPADRHLHAHGVNVPEIYDYEPLGPGCGAALVEDLGDASLLAFRGESWPSLRLRYIRAMEQLHLLHSCPFPEEFPLQPAFDEALYRWEQSYFAEHLLGAHLGLETDSFLNHPALEELAQFLASLPECPVHRDSQSQNVHIHAGKTWLIDFQGMRGGRPEYDLASLVYDGYARLEPEQAEDMLREWEKISGQPLDDRIFRACALQRLMQMLGAYANIGHNQGKTWYLAQIPAGLEHLRKLLPGSTLAEPLAAMLA